MSTRRHVDVRRRRALSVDGVDVADDAVALGAVAQHVARLCFGGSNVNNSVDDDDFDADVGESRPTVIVTRGARSTLVCRGNRVVSFDVLPGTAVTPAPFPRQRFTTKRRLLLVRSFDEQ